MENFSPRLVVFPSSLLLLLHVSLSLDEKASRDVESGRREGKQNFRCTSTLRADKLLGGSMSWASIKCRAIILNESLIDWLQCDFDFSPVESFVKRGKCLKRKWQCAWLLTFIAHIANELSKEWINWNNKPIDWTNATRLKIVQDNLGIELKFSTRSLSELICFLRKLSTMIVKKAES